MVEQKYNLSIAEEMSYDEDIICFWEASLRILMIKFGMKISLLSFIMVII